jgi:hypothetical protein
VYERTSGAPDNASANQLGLNQNQWNVPGGGGSLSLYFGGRISDQAGFLSETGLGKGASTTSAKLMNVFDVEDANVGLVVYQNKNQGPAYGFELLNTGAVNSQKMTTLNGSLTTVAVAPAVDPGTGAAILVPLGSAVMHEPGYEHAGVFSAAQFLGTAVASTGISLIASNSLGFVNIGKWEMAGTGANANQLPLTYLRVVNTFNFAGFEAAIGLQKFGGRSNLINLDANSKTTTAAPDATIVDFQMQGKVDEKSIGIYVSAGSAKPSYNSDGTQVSAGAANPFNRGSGTRGSLNLGATVEVMPRITLQGAYRLSNSGWSPDDTRRLYAVAPIGEFDNLTDNAYEAGIAYLWSQNQLLSLTYTNKSGTVYEHTVVSPTGALVGKNVLSLALETLF